MNGLKLIKKVRFKLVRREQTKSAKTSAKIGLFSNSNFLLYYCKAYFYHWLKPGKRIGKMYSSITQFEPLFPSQTGELEDLVREIVAASARLEGRLAPVVLEE
jgi:hypothetical protein